MPQIQPGQCKKTLVVFFIIFGSIKKVKNIHEKLLSLKKTQSKAGHFHKLSLQPAPQGKGRGIT